jgi:serine/threonine protein kinase
MRRVSVTVGESFAGYTILRLLGSGGMAEVYLAQHASLLYLGGTVAWVPLTGVLTSNGRTATQVNVAGHRR